MKLLQKVQKKTPLASPHSYSLQPTHPSAREITRHRSIIQPKTQQYICSTKKERQRNISRKLMQLHNRPLQEKNEKHQETGNQCRGTVFPMYTLLFNIIKRCTAHGAPASSIRRTPRGHNKNRNPCLDSYWINRKQNQKSRETSNRTEIERNSKGEVDSRMRNTNPRIASLVNPPRHQRRTKTPVYLSKNDR